jgi:hypothetical protein
MRIGRRAVAFGTVVGLGLGAAAVVAAQDLSPQEQVAALKISLAASQAVLRQHEWIETTIVRLKGEEKTRFENRCYYGADGALQKVQVQAPPPQEKKRGLRGAIAESKKEELTGYMKAAVALVKEYAPPDSARIQAAKDAGRVTLQPMPGEGKQLWLAIADYLKPGDRLAVNMNLASSQLLGVRVSSYLDTPSDPVTLNVTFATFTDGKTSYAKDVVLDAPGKQMQVEVQNSGYRKLNP